MYIIKTRVFARFEHLTEFFFFFLNSPLGTTLAVQWLRQRAFTADGRGLDPWSGNLHPTHRSTTKKGENKKTLI